MKNTPHLCAALLRDESGQDLIEYALMGGLIALAAIVAVRALAVNVATSFNTVGSRLSSAV
jgi:pilus assembly protein Flp/PilA